jgi:glycogen(starch) synthase
MVDNNNKGNTVLFEVSWEVCNKVGGINTVLRSKAERIIDHYKENYYVIGPFFANKTAGIFEEHPPIHDWKWFCDELSREGIILHFGRWLIKGEPNAILIDFNNYFYKANEIKRNLWDDYKIDSLKTGHDYDEPIVWGHAVGRALEKLAHVLKDKRLIAQFHEWLSGAALLYLKKHDVKIATVFTTHATVLGRTLSGANLDLYCIKKDTKKCFLEEVDADKESYKYGVEAKHMVEKVSANKSDVFTTVSEITGMEAQYILGRKPDIILPNGIDVERFPTFEESSIEHRMHRGNIREFLLSYFFPYYTFDLENTLFYFLAGRYEFRDKGIDVYIKALARLNDRLKKEKSRKTIIAFIWVPTQIRAIRPDFLENKTFYNDIRDALDEKWEEIKKRILYAFISKREIKGNDIFEKDFLLDIKRRVLRLKRQGSPFLSTHDVADPNDTIMRHLYDSGLDNMEDDRVKVVFYPIYLTGADGLLDLTYYESINGCHLGVFPSFYEPWGYTPLETAALGVPAVTTDLAGFGKFIQKQISKNNPGIYVLERLGRTDEEIIEDLAQFMYWYTNLTKSQRVQNKIEAKKLSDSADWSVLIKNYIDSHDLALKKRGF